MKKLYVLMVVIVTMLMVACSSPSNNEYPNDNSTKNVETLEIYQSGEYNILKTIYGDIKIPYAFSDVIESRKITTDADTEFIFSVNVDGYSMDAYKITFGTAKDNLIGVVNEDIAVSVEIFSLDKNSIKDSEQTFYAAQETINDAIGSIYEWEKFTPVK